jgi:hypothetical protein
MIKRLLLNRIDAVSAGTPIGGKDDLIVLIGAHETQSALALA